MKVLLLWNKDREDGWLLGRIALKVESTTIEKALEELHSTFFTLRFVREHLQDTLNEEIQDYEELEDKNFFLDKVEYRDWVVCFDFKNNDGDTITVKRNQNEILTLFN